MCGIAGWFKTDETTKEQDDIAFEIGSKLLVETQSRGTDASGFSYINDYGRLVTVKGPIAGEAMVNESNWKALKENMPQSLILHCRAMTNGTPLNNMNNHPVVANKEISVIHNGTIQNYQELISEYDLPAKGQVDSEAIPLLINKRLGELTKDSGVNSLKVAKAINMASQELNGGFACAMLYSKTPGVMYLFNHNNPIVLVYSETLNYIFFASEKDIMEKSFDLPSNSVVKQKWFRGVKHSFEGDDLSSDTISILKLDGFKCKKTIEPNEKLNLSFDLEFFALDANKTIYGTSSGVHFGEVWDTTQSKYVKRKITKTLKAKDGFDGKLFEGEEDWVQARKDSNSCSSDGC